jgi:hypothetical protein
MNNEFECKNLYLSNLTKLNSFFYFFFLIPKKKTQKTAEAVW